MLGNSYSVTDFTKPNAKLKAITSSINMDIKNLSKNDLVIVCGGSKDTGESYIQARLNSLTHFVHIPYNTNVIIMCVPHRFDYESLLSVKEAVKVKQ
jgi:hypothetical protein